jgi:hypothetical protein
LFFQPLQFHSEATPAEEMDDDGFKKPKSLVVGTPDADALLVTLAPLFLTLDC